MFTFLKELNKRQKLYFVIAVQVGIILVLIGFSYSALFDSPDQPNNKTTRTLRSDFIPY